MEFRSLQNKIYDYGPRGHFLIESFLINLLRIHITSQNKEFVSEEKLGPRSLFDAYVPMGFDDFEGPTYIEITSTPQSKRLFYRLEKSYAFIKKESVKNILFIVTRPIPKSTMHDISSFQQKKLGVNIIVWGPEEIQSIIEKHKDKVSELGDRLFTLRLETAIHKPQQNWKENREAILASVKNSYNSGQFSFFLGAGVSSSAGLPDWNTLLNSLFVSLLTSEFNGDKKTDDNEISSIVKRLREVD